MTAFALQKLQPEYKCIHSKIQDKFKKRERLRGRGLQLAWITGQGKQI